MNTEQTAQQLELAAQIIRTGAAWEYLSPYSQPEWRKEHRPDNNPVYRVANKFKIRLAVELDDPCAELKAAHAAGKVIQWYNGVMWVDHIMPTNSEPIWVHPAKDLRIKPWSLPSPPPGKSWHRTDGWTEEMLPKSYRPLLAGEKLRRVTDSYCYHIDGGWDSVFGLDGELPRDPSDSFWRTTRPLPAEPEFIDLGPEDVTLFCALRFIDKPQNEYAITSIVEGQLKSYVMTFDSVGLKGRMEINRSIPLTGKWNPDAWEPCHKPA